MWKFQRLAIDLRPGFFLLLAAGLLVFPLPWVGAWLLAVTVHETFHLLAARLSGGAVGGIALGGGGMEIKIGPLEPKQAFLTAMAGPLGSICLVFLAPWLPRTAVCGFLQAVFNLLPIMPLDGGRALRVLLCRFQKNGRRVAARVENGTIFLAFAACVYGFFRLELGIFPILLLLLFLFKTGKIKISCKPGLQRLQ